MPVWTILGGISSALWNISGPAGTKGLLQIQGKDLAFKCHRICKSRAAVPITYVHEICVYARRR